MSLLYLGTCGFLTMLPSIISRVLAALENIAAELSDAMVCTLSLTRRRNSARDTASSARVVLAVATAPTVPAPAVSGTTTPFIAACTTIDESAARPSRAARLADAGEDATWGLVAVMAAVEAVVAFPALSSATSSLTHFCMVVIPSLSCLY
jgi:hypothetical protein